MARSAPMLGDSSPFACLRRDDLWESLAKNPATRPYVADSGFQATIKKLQNGADDQAAAQEAMKDPRVMAAVAALQGWGLDVSEEDIKHAESVGDLKKRDPVQMGDLEEAHRHATVDAAKAAGNEFFKAQAFSKALACYQRALALQREQSGGEAAAPAPVGSEAAAAGEGLTEEERALASTLHSNSAASLLKLRRPKEALAACELALRCAPPGGDVSKVHFRCAQAGHEELQPPWHFPPPRQPEPRPAPGTGARAAQGPGRGAQGAAERQGGGGRGGAAAARGGGGGRGGQAHAARAGEGAGAASARAAGAAREAGAGGAGGAGRSAPRRRARAARRRARRAHGG